MSFENLIRFYRDELNTVIQTGRMDHLKYYTRRVLRRKGVLDYDNKKNARSRYSFPLDTLKVLNRCKQEAECI